MIVNKLLTSGPIYTSSENDNLFKFLVFENVPVCVQIYFLVQQFLENLKFT